MYCIVYNGIYQNGRFEYRCEASIIMVCQDKPVYESVVLYYKIDN